MKTVRIDNILVATDFSPIARYAVQHAEAIAKRTHATLTLVHVLEPVSDAVGTSGMLELSVRIEEQRAKDVKKKLARIAQSIAKKSSITVKTLALSGRIAPALREAMTATHTDLVVMGTHGASGFVENLLGSTTYRIASTTAVPVLSVHKRMDRPGYKHIIYPVREHARALDKFPVVLTFAKLFKARVQIIGLIKTGQKRQEQEMRAQCSSVQERFAADKVPATITFTDKGFFPDAAMRFAHTHAGSLVVIVQDADFHLVEVFQGTFTKKVLHRVLSPVLTVPRQ